MMRYLILLLALLAGTIPASSHAGIISVADAKQFTLNAIPYINAPWKPVDLNEVTYTVDGVGTKTFELPLGDVAIPLSLEEFSTQPDGNLGIRVQGQVQDFKSFLVDHGAQYAAHWILSQAVAVSTDHTAAIILGRPLGSSSYSSQWMLLATYHIPEPSSLLLSVLGLGLLGIAKFQRGQIVRHVLTKDRFVVLRRVLLPPGGYLVRCMSLRRHRLRGFELKECDEKHAPDVKHCGNC